MTPLRLLLNSGFSGANAFLALAQANGSFRAAGLDLEFVPGRGAWTAATRLADDEADVAYGDINALAELAALRGTAGLPRAFFMVHQHSPATITVPLDGTVWTPQDLVGRRVVGHASDVALQLFPAWSSVAGLAPDAVQVVRSDASMADLLTAMQDGDFAGVFGYVSTHQAAWAGLGRDAVGALRFLRYRQVWPALYGSALMASEALLRAQPDVVRCLVQVVRAAIADARNYPERAIDAVLERSPLANRVIEQARWQETCESDMGFADQTGQSVGDIDVARFATTQQVLARACGRPATADSGGIFTRRFLAPLPA